MCMDKNIQIFWYDVINNVIKCIHQKVLYIIVKVY